MVALERVAGATPWPALAAAIVRLAIPSGLPARRGHNCQGRPAISGRGVGHLIASVQSMVDGVGCFDGDVTIPPATDCRQRGILTPVSLSDRAVLAALEDIDNLRRCAARAEGCTVLVVGVNPTGARHHHGQSGGGGLAWINTYIPMSTCPYEALSQGLALRSIGYLNFGADIDPWLGVQDRVSTRQVE